MTIRTATALLSLFLAAPLLAGAQGCKLLKVAEWPIRNTGYQPLLDGEINGKKVSILVDTGAYSSLITKAAAVRLGLPVGEIRGATVYGVGGESQALYADIAELKIGEATRKGWQILVAGEHDLGNNIALVLGDDFFEKVDLELDFPHNVMRLFQPQGCGDTPLAYWARQGAGIVPIEPGTKIHVTVSINGTSMRAMLDTGASRSGVATSAAAALGRKPGAPGVEPGGCTFGIGGKVVDQYVAAFDSFTIGDETIRNPRLQILDLWGGRPTYQTGTRLSKQSDIPAEMLLGFDFLKTHRVFISRTQRKLYFTHEGGLVFPTVSGQSCGGTLERGNTAEQIKKSDEAIANDPKDVGALLARGDAYYQKREDKLALADYDAVLRLDPANASALWSRGNVHHRLKDYDRAIADYTAAITGDSARHARVYASRGNSWRAKGELDKALADFNQAIALDPQDSYALTSRAFIWMQKGDDAKAAADLDALANRDPSDPDLFGRGLAFFRGGRFAAAEKDFAAAVKKSPTQIKAIWLYLAQAHGGVPSASADLGKNAAPFEGKGWPQPVIHLYTGKLDETQLFAAAQDPDEKKKRDQECEANYYVAQKRLLAGNKDGARELLKKASADCPRDFIEYNSAVSDLARIK